MAGGTQPDPWRGAQPDPWREERSPIYRPAGPCEAYVTDFSM